jgi:hypothetical protein
MESRWDSVDSYFITNQLQSFDPQTRYHLVPGVVGRKYIPKIANASPNLPSYKYTMTKVQGSTNKAARGRSKNAPTVNVVKEEVVASIKTFENTATWSIDDIRAARETNSDLDMDTMVASMTAIEQDFDSALCSGVSGTNITGLANNTAISATTAQNSSWLTGNAGGPLTGEQIASDVRKLIQDASTALKQAQVPGSGMRMFDQFALWLPLAHYQYIDMTPRSSTSPSDTTILGFISKFSALKAIIPWWRLDTAGVSGIPKAVLTPALDNGAMNPLAGGALLPMDFERLPEQPSGRMVSVPCAGKCGGMVIPYPIAYRYLTGL